MSDFYSDNSYQFFFEVDAIDFLIPEPAKWDAITIKIKRDIKNHGFGTEFIDPNTSLEFDCSDRDGTLNSAGDIISNVYDGTGKSIIPLLGQAKGNDGVIIFKVGDIDKVTLVFTELFRGKLDLNTLDTAIDVAKVQIERISFEDLLRTRFETLVDVTETTNIDGNVITPLVPVNMELHSKFVIKEYRAEDAVQTSDNTADPVRFFIQPKTGGPGNSETNFNFIDFQLAEFNNVITNEINETFTLPSAQFKWGLDEVPIGVLFPSPLIDIKEPGAYTIEVNMLINSTINAILDGSFGTNGGLTCGHNGGRWNEVTEQLKIVITDSSGIQKEDITINEVLFSEIELTNCPTAANGVNFTFGLRSFSSGVLNFDLNFGDRIYIFFRYFVQAEFDRRNVTPYALEYEFFFTGSGTTTSFIEVKANTEFAPTDCNTFLHYETLDKTIEAVTGQSDALRSTLIGRTDSTPNSYGSDGCRSLIAFTNGYQIRQFPILDRPVFFSIADLIDNLKTIDSVGFGYELESGIDKFRLESRDFFFQDVEIVLIDNVSSDITVKTAKDFIYNEIEIAYTKWADEEINNLDEFATKHNYSTGIKSVKKKLSLISPYIASAYLIEFARRLQFADLPTKDNENDEENFLISVRRFASSFIPEKDEMLESSSNVFSPETGYNFRYSLKRSLIRYIEFIKGFLFYKDQSTHVIKFLFGEANYQMITDFINSEAPCEFIENIGESDDLSLSLFSGVPYYTPEWIDFSCRLTKNQLLQIKSAISGNDPNLKDYGFISYIDRDGITKKGWLYNLDYSPDNGEAKFKLLNNPN